MTDINQDIFGLFLSKDEDKNPAVVLNVTPDVYTCMICPQWLGTEEDALEHGYIHPPEHCFFCNRLIYLVDIPDNPFKGPKENSNPICSICYKNAVAFSKTFAYKWKHFSRQISDVLNQFLKSLKIK